VLQRGGKLPTVGATRKEKNEASHVKFSALSAVIMVCPLYEEVYTMPLNRFYTFHRILKKRARADMTLHNQI
jgi:hypothetical protein